MHGFRGLAGYANHSDSLVMSPIRTWADRTIKEEISKSLVLSHALLKNVSPQKQWLAMKELPKRDGKVGLVIDFPARRAQFGSC